MNKEEILLKYSKSEFSNFLSSDRNKDVLKLFDDNGLNIFKKCSIKEERINYILVYSPYINELFHNPEFVDMFLKTRINDYYANLSRLSEDSFEYIVNRCLNTNNDLIPQLFKYYKEEYLMKGLNKFNFNSRIISDIFKSASFENKLRIINAYNLDLAKSDVKLEQFFVEAKEYAFNLQTKRNNGIEVEELTIPVNIMNKHLAQRLWDENKDNIYQLRNIINNASFFTNIDEINDYVKSEEELLINKYNSNELISPYLEIFNSYKSFDNAKKMMELDNKNIDYQDEFVRSRFNLNKILQANFNRDAYEKINNVYEEKGIEGIKIFTYKLSNNMLSNYIFDYHFEENFNNINIDIQELFNFYARGHMNLSSEKRELYEDLMRFDDLSPSEKIKYHEKLKAMNPSIKEVFYDDMAFAKKIVGTAIKDAALTREELTNYLDEEKSRKYGVDVYVMDGEPFFALVKTGSHPSDQLPTGHSYSLVGTDCLAVFGDVKDSKSFVYDVDELNSEQFVHVYPYDSFTYFHPLEISDTASRKIYKLLMPDELTRLSKSYNEVLLLEKGVMETDLDEKIPRLKKMALYCLDEIRDQDIVAAKANGVGIILINSKKYELEKNHNLDRTIGLHTGFDDNYESDSCIDKNEMHRL